MRPTSSLSRLNLVTATAVVLTSGLAAARGDVPSYHFKPLDEMIETVFPGVDYPSSDSRTLNEDGDLVGDLMLNGGLQRGWIYTVEHGVVELSPLPGDTRAMIRDVSPRDANGDVLIVGMSTFIVDPEMAVVWRFSTVTGEVVETRAIGIPPGHDESIAVAVNNDGTVIGYTSYIGAYTNWKYDFATGVLETFDFPWRVADLNNVGQVCGGVYRGDLFGNYEDLSDTYEPGDVMPDWAIDNGGISAGWHRINDQGWLVGRAATGISDGAGHYKVAIVRFADPIGWVGFPPISHLSMPGGINDQGDFTDRSGGVYLQETGQIYAANFLLAPQFQQIYHVYISDEINNHRQIAGSSGHAFLLTPLGVMVIPGDVNGDVRVDLDDHCAWLANPIDLDGDGLVDADDELWLIDRLAVFGFTIQDCNGNGLADHCDILDGLSQDCDFDDVPDECQADCNGDGVPDACEPDCNGNGVPDPCDIGQGTSEDCNGNGIPDECDGGGVTDVMHVFDPPLDLPGDTTITHDITVYDTGLVDDVDFIIDIQYRIGDLSVLLEHNGVTITLIDRPGYPDYVLGNGQLGYDIILDDEGTGGAIEDQGNFGSPFEPITSQPSYTPDDPLSTFDGMPMEGTWTVHAIIRDYHPAHTFQDWGLTFTRASVPVTPCCTTDLDSNSTVNVADLLLVLAAWGTPDGDVTGDGTTDVADLLELLADWGPCP